MILRKVKVGDLVMWTHPQAKDIGIVLEAPPTKFGNQANIHWFGAPECSGYYPPNHELLELYCAAG